MVTLSLRVLNKSVFRKIARGTAMNDILAVLFHRTAATMYFIYTLWAITSILTGIPTVTNSIGDLGQFTFSSLVLITAAPACFGATFWPSFARLELFAGSGFSMAILIYLYLIFHSIINSGSALAGFILIWSIVVLPVARTVIVIIFLLRQAKERKSQEL